jgi:hypothetical protein
MVCKGVASKAHTHSIRLDKKSQVENVIMMIAHQYWEWVFMRRIALASTRL